VNFLVKTRRKSFDSTNSIYKSDSRFESPVYSLPVAGYLLMVAGSGLRVEGEDEIARAASLLAVTTRAIGHWLIGLTAWDAIRIKTCDGAGGMR